MIEIINRNRRKYLQFYLSANLSIKKYREVVFSNNSCFYFIILCVFAILE